ncbi:glutamate decarboxylase [Ascoidea rubescens DSM 1968]|uniref:Glutamate decarboxylase n=1 Tax=Ascoidea rubescens DSM 1968 TaxID=1344418 RepID=A0A1D2VIS1_9ASCO|nr:glutamate decarboxylase [Ascoidea rubescens DSM 1968]ODV61532.1 glutamate decarboxylase [Ascoidea rubescens DSM 1968]
MSLDSHIDPEKLETKLILENQLKHKNIHKNHDHFKIKSKISNKYSFINNRNSNNNNDIDIESSSNLNLNSNLFSISKYKIPNKGLDSNLAYELIHNDLNLDGNPTLNLASFVNTFISDHSDLLIQQNITKNLADNDEYPILMDIHKRCISILSSLWHADPKNSPIGTATTGSSEAIMLAGLALKKNWQSKMKKLNKPFSNPNILMGANAQVALEKFARYFDVEPRIIPVSQNSNYLIDIDQIEKNIDENTIGIFVILGSTYTGGFEDVLEISNLLDKIYERNHNLDIPIHVDGASGAMIAPFVFPKLKWDFKIKRVHSINTSGHKFGLTSVGLGWVVWRSSCLLPNDLKFQLSYLGGVEESFTINFSRPGYQVIHQYFNFLHLGKLGYRSIFNNCLSNARLLSKFLEKSNYFECISNIHRSKNVMSLKDSIELNDDPELDNNKSDNNSDNNDNNDILNPGLPVVAFKFSNEFIKNYPQIPQSMVSTLLRNKGFIIPYYPLPNNESDTEVLRIVVKETLNLELLDKLMMDIIEITEVLINAANQVQRSTKFESDEARSDNNQIIYDMLLSISSAGLQDDKIKTIKTKKSYRGTC